MLMLMPHAYAATYSLSDANNLVKGCSTTVEIKMDTQGENVIAGDTTILFDSNEVTVDTLAIGTPLPMLAFNQINADNLKLSGARLPFTGSYNGSGTFGYITFTPSLTEDTGTFTFSPDLVTANNMVSDAITNVLTGVSNKTYNFQDRYNTEVDGVGFCTPDLTAPTVQFITPVAGSANNPVDTNVIFSLSDNRAGVDIDSLTFSINGTSINPNSPQVTTELDNGVYRIETDPTSDFQEGEDVPISVTICDLNVPANCKTSSTTIYIWEPAPPPPVCGNGILEPAGGEQCDDGNLVSEDGCSSLCLNEIIVIPEASCSNGIHDANEDGIDCGGTCAACATCVDGIINQGETGVDCGGPCPTCDLVCALPGETTSSASTFDPEGPAIAIDEEQIIICHFPEEDPTNPYSLQIGESFLDEHLAHGDTVGPCPLPEAQIVEVPATGNIAQEEPAEEEEEAPLLAFLAPEEEEPEPEPLPQEYVANITSNDCDIDAPFQSVEILGPENNIVSSDLKPEITGSVTQNTEKVAIYRTRLELDGSRAVGAERELVGEVAEFGNYPAVDQCDNIIAYKNFSLRSYSAFENQSKYVIEAEAFYEEVVTTEDGEIAPEFERSIISAVNLGFDNGLFSEPPSELALDGEPIPEESISADASGNIAIHLDESWIPKAHAQNGANPFDINNEQPELTGLTEEDSQVFAVWNSPVVLNSDAKTQSEGAFSIKAPRALEKGEAHRVTLYAVKQDLSGNKLRSPSVTVHFFVAERGLPLPIILGALVTIGVLSIAAIALRERLLKGNTSVGRKLTRKEKVSKAKKISKRLLK